MPGGSCLFVKEGTEVPVVGSWLGPVSWRFSCRVGFGMALCLERTVLWASLLGPWADTPLPQVSCLVTAALCHHRPGVSAFSSSHLCYVHRLRCDCVKCGACFCTGVVQWGYLLV